MMYGRLTDEDGATPYNFRLLPKANCHKNCRFGDDRDDLNADSFSSLFSGPFRYWTLLATHYLSVLQFLVFFKSFASIEILSRYSLCLHQYHSQPCFATYREYGLERDSSREPAEQQPPHRGTRSY
jgi:hypothetical protein